MLVRLQSLKCTWATATRGENSQSAALKKVLRFQFFMKQVRQKKANLVLCVKSYRD